jgi:hypothetical protein
MIATSFTLSLTTRFCIHLLDHLLIGSLASILEGSAPLALARLPALPSVQPSRHIAASETSVKFRRYSDSGICNAESEILRRIVQMADVGGSRSPSPHGLLKHLY